MKESNSVTKDPICGMTVDGTTALHAEREGCDSRSGQPGDNSNHKQQIRKE